MLADTRTFRTFARKLRVAAFALPFALGACQAGNRDGAALPGDRDDTRPYGDVAQGELVHFTGTEPFWGGQVAGDTLTYTTPEQPDGESVPVSHFAGRGGLSYSGKLSSGAFTMAISPGDCSDGMSDRIYPYLVMLKLGEDVRSGCGWTDKHPFKDGDSGETQAP